jgi:hypothetical protein
MTATQTPAAPDAQPARTPSPPRGEGRGIAMMIAGSVAALLAIALLSGGGTLLYFDSHRDSAGYVSTDMTSYSTGTYAVVSDSYRAGRSGDVFVPADILGRIRVHARSSEPLFIGIGPAAAVDRYLGRVAREQVNSFAGGHHGSHVIGGASPATPPAAQRFWAAGTTGTGDRSITWQSRSGDWRVVVMSADGSAGVNADVAIGARFPHIVTIGLVLLGTALLTGTASALLIRFALRHLKR